MPHGLFCAEGGNVIVFTLAVFWKNTFITVCALLMVMGALLGAHPVSSQDYESTYEEIASFEVGPLHDLTVLNDRQAVVATDEGVWVLDLDDQILLPTDLPVTRVAARSRPGSIAAVYSDHTIGLWDYENRTEVATLTGHTDTITHMAALDRWLLTGSADHTVRLWNTDDQELVGVMTHSGDVTAVTIGFDGQEMIAASGSDDGTIQLWLPRWGRELGVLNIGEPITGLQVLTQRGQIVASTTSGKLHCWTIPTRTLFEYEGESLTLFEVPLETGVQELALLRPTRRTADFIDPHDPAAGVIAWEGNWRTLDPVFPPAEAWTETFVIEVHDSAITQLLAYDYGTITVDSDHRAVVWFWGDQITTLSVTPIQLEADVIGDLSNSDIFSALLATPNADHSISLWSIQDGAEIARLVGHTAPPTHVARASIFLFSADDSGSVRMWARRL